MTSRHNGPAQQTDPKPESAVMEILLHDRRKYLNFLSARLGNRELAEEILQNVVIKVLQSGSALRSQSSAEAWLYRVLRNALVDHYRRHAAASRRVEGNVLNVATPDPGPEGRVCPCAQDQLGRLRPEYQDALRQMEMENASASSYAASRAITPNTAFVRLHRARKALRLRVQQICGTCAGAGCFDCCC